ncbi:MAG: hypothetical protein JWQ61_206 [Collimonas fungivorans]|uniref:hypothetical protein n=1 Tax=Collimonas fungivorans TaxID=158899 RepID=UPI0026EACCA5|nr:hypothetical protein [Collimonas fungivorans]MDB5765392.1 hypothetical protein [Collimonas fungivorans]
MFRLLNKLAEDQKLVSAIFDHTRNFIIGITIMAVGAWRFKLASTGYWAIYDSLVAFLVSIMGFSLLLINHLSMRIKFGRAATPRWLVILIFIVYAIVAGTYFRYLSK